MSALLNPPPASERTHARLQQLMADAREAAAEHVRQLEAALATVERLSADVEEGGEAYPPGVRDVARRISNDAAWSARTLDTIMGRVASRRIEADRRDAA